MGLRLTPTGFIRGLGFCHSDLDLIITSVHCVVSSNTHVQDSDKIQIQAICHVHVTLTLRGPSVCNIGGSWKWVHDRIGRCLGYLHAQVNPDCSILWYTEKHWWGIEKCGVLHSGGNNLCTRQLGCRAILASAELLVSFLMILCLLHTDILYLAMSYHSQMVMLYARQNNRMSSQDIQSW